MTDQLQEFCDSRGLALRADRGGVIRGIKVLGLHSRNSREYLPEALARAASLYEGAKVNVNHPKGHPLAPRDYQERIGVIRNVQHRPGQGLFADFHFNPKHYLSEQLVWDAEHALVADPATTRGLFESSGAGFQPADAPLHLPWGEGRVEDPPWRSEGHSAAALEEQPASSSESHSHELSDEISRLRLELDGLRAKEAADQRRTVIAALLAEYRLPAPDATDPTAKAIVGETFLQSLLAAPDDQSMRRLVEDRARLVTCAKAWDAASKLAHRQPTSRDQTSFAPAPVLDAKSFAQAITA